MNGKIKRHFSKPAFIRCLNRGLRRGITNGTKKHKGQAKKAVLAWGDFGKITIAQVIGVNHWIIIPLFVIGGLLPFWWFEKKEF